MQKYNKNKKIHTRSHHVRISAVAIALATGFHLSGSTHLGSKFERSAVVASSRAYTNMLERENETARHMVRFDAGLRLPSTSGSSL